MKTRLVLLAMVLATLAVTAAPAAALETGGKSGLSLERAVITAHAGTLGADATIPVWIRFTDKALDGESLALALRWREDELPREVRERRAKTAGASPLVDTDDLPVPADYLAAVEATGVRPRHVSRWLNAISCDATVAQIEAAARLPFVAAIEPLRRGVRNDPDLENVVAVDPVDDKILDAVSYGASLIQNETINTLPAHASGLSGRGVTVAVFDTGFDLDRASLRHLNVVGAWNFIGDNDDVGDNLEESEYQVFHGTAILSVLAGYQPGALIGTAPGVDVILAKTENLADETSAEEDHWVAALEWAEGLGADVVSSSIGYIDWYDFSDLDGRTAAITVAAELAAARGVCIVNTAGNERNNANWPHIIPPADGPHVISVGGVDTNGLVAGYSSPGPTADGRIKPDVLALGDNVRTAHAFNETMIIAAAGNDYAAPAVAGVVAMMLEANPGLTPDQVLEALHGTASRALLPDNDYGWGLTDAAAAIAYWNPVISHEPIPDAEGGTGASYPISAEITAGAELDPDLVRVAWRYTGGNWHLLTMAHDVGDTYTAVIPPQPLGVSIEYYIAATDITGNTGQNPADAPFSFHTFRVGPDTSPPAITHYGLSDQVPSHWPPTVTAEIEDDFGLASVQLITSTSGGVQAVTPMPLVGDRYELPLPIVQQDAPVGTMVTYLIRATDASNAGHMTVTRAYTFEVVASRGRVLLVDDRDQTMALEGPSRPGAVPPAADEKAIADVADWITSIGFEVDQMSASTLPINAFLGYDVVMVSCGQNYNPLAQDNLRSEMFAWAGEGGRIIIEGGEVAYSLDGDGIEASLRSTVLHIREWFGEDGLALWTPDALRTHPFHQRPNVLPSPFLLHGSGLGYGESDLASPAGDGLVVLQSNLGPGFGGVIVHDTNACPDAGQTVFMPFDITLAAQDDAVALLDNVLTWLTIDEAPGGSTISGVVTLDGESDHSGVTVRTSDGHEATTAADGSFSIDGLWAGWYTLTAEADGFGSASQFVLVGENDEAYATFQLVPAVTLHYAATPEAPIPDNDPAGLVSEIIVPTGTRVLGLDIDIDISHFSMGHLIVELTSPVGTTVRLHNQTGGSADDLIGNYPATMRVSGPGALVEFLDEDPRGAWRLTVSDNLFGALGTLHGWGLNLTLAADGVTANEDDPTPNETPKVTRLLGNAPNPFNPTTELAFEMAAPGPVRLLIHDARGRTVRRLVDRAYPIGRHSVTWDGRSDGGSALASGTYFARFDSGETVTVRKMTLVR